MQANGLIKSLQAELADLQTARLQDRARLKLAAQVLLAQGAGKFTSSRSCGRQDRAAAKDCEFTMS